MGAMNRLVTISHPKLPSYMAVDLFMGAIICLWYPFGPTVDVLTKLPLIRFRITSFRLFVWDWRLLLFGVYGSVFQSRA